VVTRTAATAVSPIAFWFVRSVFPCDDERMYIDPIACVDCAACIPACPVHAISESGDLSADQTMWIRINADKSNSTPVIRSKQTPLAGAEDRRTALGYGDS